MGPFVTDYRGRRHRSTIGHTSICDLTELPLLRRTFVV